MFKSNEEAFRYLYDRQGLLCVQVMLSAVRAYGADTGSVQVLTLLNGVDNSFDKKDEKALVRAMRYVEEHLPQWQEDRVVNLPDGQQLTIDPALVPDEY
ncbi:hypothetical protein C5Y96_10450 [Blastopirellula marina]|uniref:Uncharacterized protein n=1 Tax=Blastopirellula marina TaxID=124 RepID=A0A2S8FM66_9BACT|nr:MULTISPECIES: hypothetical protein [Pirellulaceae]PQO33265.1 hypothetical protein C5Y96_10450 [Blastopirellula marina]RCS52354.1 hypothetical protein DTL36_10460 [Bremerella cremea]